MHVRVRLIGQPEAIVVVESKLTKIEKFRRIIHEKFNVEVKSQRLFYGGKLLENGYTFHDYNIKLNDVIQLMVRAQPIDEEPFKIVAKTKQIENTPEEIIYEDTTSKIYAIGDLIDMRDREQGAWFEGKVVRIVKDPSYTKHDAPSPKQVNCDEESDSENKPPASSFTVATNSKTTRKEGIAKYFSKLTKLNEKQNESMECGILFKVHLDADSKDTENEHYCKLKEIRPRARKEIDVSDLEPGQIVMINHNTEDRFEKGYWYDFKIDQVKRLRVKYELIGTLYLGPDAVPQNDTVVRVDDKIFAIEEVIPLADRSEELIKQMVTQTKKRSSPLNCLTCRDVENVPCKECGCYLCSGKESPEKIVLCDECDKGHHMHCLSPPLTEIPEEDWYCPSCKRDTNTVVAPGAAKQIKKSTASNTTRDWGRGMACVGKTKTCAMPANHFGPIPGIEVGMCWRFRIQMSESGVHRPPVSGIHGRDSEGAFSIVLSGGYEDDYDNGDEFTYTGSGGRDLSGNKRTAEQSCDQNLTRENKALARNCAVKQISEEGADAGEMWRKGQSVRVVRASKMMKYFPQYAPKEGFRYDGIYKVVKYYPEQGKSGFRVWKYLLRRDDPNPAPWAEDAKQYPIVYPDGYLEAEAEKLALKGKANEKTKKVAKKRETEDDMLHNSPPRKKATRSKIKNSVGEEKLSKASKSPESPKKKIPDMFAAIKSPNSNQKLTKVAVEHVLTNGELEAIKADTSNSKLWNECIDVSKNSGKKAFVENVTTVFLCIICQDVSVTPVTTPCLHNFCMGCITLSFKSTGNKSCPVCRGDLSKFDIQPNDKLKSALQAIMPGYDAGRK